MQNLTLNDFDYYLPEELIANTPSAKRDESKLLIVDELKTTIFKNIIDYINPHDLLIFNDSKVFKARLFGNKPTGGKVEILIEKIIDNKTIIAHVRSNKTINYDLNIICPNQLKLSVTKKLNGLFELKSTEFVDWIHYLEQYGHVPLPPYIKRSDNQTDNTRYQTIYAREYGSVAAPTAGLHFTEELINQIKNKGALIDFVTLHVGSGTFKSVSVDKIADHVMHQEYYTVKASTIDLINQTKQNGGRVIAVGTTSVRTLETVALNNYVTLNGDTNIFITPRFEFKVVDTLITNFHLPKSTLMMLVSAFAGMNTIKNAYLYAINNKFRFFSYGDAMLLNLNKDK